TLQPIPNQTTHVGGILSPITLTMSDDITLTEDMGVTATSSNPAVLTNNNILIGGGSIRTLSAAPATQAMGTTMITVTVTDSSFQTAQQTFQLTVDDGPPTITGLGDQTIAGGSVLGPISFTVGDDLTAPGALTVTASSSNTTLLPNVDLVV